MNRLAAVAVPCFALWAVAAPSHAATLTFEAETLARTDSGTGTTLQTDANTSGGQWVSLDAEASGSWIEFTLPSVPAGSYTVRLRYKTNDNRGQLTLKIDGVQVGGTLEQYRALPSAYPEATLGTASIAVTGSHKIRLTVTGKASASKSYVLSADRFTLEGGDGGATPTPTPTAPNPGPTATPTATLPPTSGTVYFQSEGSKRDFPNYPQEPQNKGRIDDVTSPVYKGSSAIRFEQTYVKNAPERFHSEVTVYGSQQNGQDKYYGFALYLPTTWHNESVKDNFQQWGTENPGGPWLIMHIDQDHIKAGHPNTFGTTDFGAISKGVWHRTVARLRMQNNVPFEFWVDGTKRGAPNCTCSATGGSVRWSAGLYISYWYDRYRTSGLPSGSQTVRYLYQDQYRITSSLASADPAGW